MAGPRREGERSLIRLAAVVRQRVGAEDARLEVGGEPPQGDRFLWVQVPDSAFRLVAAYSAPPFDRERKLELMHALAESFSGTVARAVSGKRDPRPTRAGSPQGELDEALIALADMTGAVSALVVDASSPVLWGRSHPALDIAPREECAAALTRLGRRLEEAAPVDAAISELLKAPPATRILRLAGAGDDPEDGELLAELERAPERFEQVALTARTAEWVRRELSLRARESRLPLPRLVEHGAFPRFARGLADVYGLALAFAAPVSEPTVDGAVRRAVPLLERLIEAVPPLDPRPVTRRARVIALRRR